MIDQSTLQKILDLEKKTLTNEETGQERTIENFTYDELVDFLHTNHLSTIDIVESLQDLLTACLAATVAKVTKQGGIGQEIKFEIDPDKTSKIVNILNQTVELRKNLGGLDK